MKSTRLPIRHPLVAFSLLIVALLLVSATIRPTEASWVDGEVVTTEVAAATLLPVAGLECYDNSDGSVLGLNLLDSNLLLVWAPLNALPPDAAVEYEVAWTRGALGGSDSATTTDNHYLYNAAPSLLGLTVRFTIRAKAGPWTSAPVEYRATQVGLAGLSALIWC